MEWLKISTSTEYVRLQTDDIVFVQADGNYSDIYLRYSKNPRKMTFPLHYFDTAFSRLHENFFVRVGRSLIIKRIPT